MAARFKAAVDLIEKGKQAARLDMAGPDPPLHMPAWQNKLNPRQINAIMGYFVSLATNRKTKSKKTILAATHDPDGSIRE